MLFFSIRPMLWGTFILGVVIGAAACWLLIKHKK